MADNIKHNNLNKLHWLLRMPPRLIVKKRPVLAEQPVRQNNLGSLEFARPTSSDSEELSVTEVSKPKVKRIVKRVVKKEVTTSPGPEPVVDVIEEDPLTIYLSSLNNSDRIVMEIAKDHLGTSFCMEKSVGFVEFLTSRK